MLKRNAAPRNLPFIEVNRETGTSATACPADEPGEQTLTPILKRPVFERLIFAQCWEDPRMDAESLCLRPGKTALVVTSGGCTALSLALLKPDRIFAVDLNAAQSNLLRLKIAGVKWPWRPSDLMLWRPFSRYRR